MEFTQDQITAVLPHRAPFLFATGVDVDCERSVAEGRVDFSRLQPVWNGVFDSPAEQLQEFLLEAAAQILGVLLAAADAQGDAGAEDEKHLLLGFENVEFTGAVDNSADIGVRVELTGRFGKMYKADISASLEGCALMTGALSVMKG